MRIIKYVFLLILLGLVAVTVFVATQKGEFDITKSKVIKSPRPIIYNYVNDYRNWENWIAWKEESPDMTFSYPGTSVGKGATFTFKSSDSEGSMKTVYAKENDSISQILVNNGIQSKVYWKFKDTVGGTKVTWRTKGRMGFMSKIYAVTKGGADFIIGEMYEKSLANLDKTLDYEINTYNVKTSGVVEKPGTMFLRQTITSTIDNAPKNMQIMLSKMTSFFKKNKIPMNGKPFTIYNYYDTAKGLTKFSVCVPIREEIFTSYGSDIAFGRLEPMRALKTTLKGDYSHRKEAWTKALQYLSENNLERSTEIKLIEVFSKNVDDVKSPSKWVTDIYIPIRTAAAVPPPAVRRPTVRSQPTPVIATPVQEPATTQP